jgi:hypothetical protein
MKTLVRPSMRAPQALLRALNAEACTPTPLQDTLCASCWRRIQQRQLGTARRQQHVQSLLGSPQQVRGWQTRPVMRRTYATVTDNPQHFTPLEEYDERVHSRKLRDDEHQRSM